MLFFLFVSERCDAQAIDIDKAAFVVQQDKYCLDATLSFILGASPTEALMHGIPLYFHIAVKIDKWQAWLWDEQMVKRLFVFILQYRPLSGLYVVTYVNTGKQLSFKSLQQALENLGTIKKVPVFSTSVLEKAHLYTAKLNVHLHIPSLPLPMRLVAYLSPEWRLQSEAFTWEFSAL